MDQREKEPVVTPIIVLFPVLVFRFHVGFPECSPEGPSTQL